VASYVHKNNRISFEAGGRRFEAVGFLNEDEPYVTEEELLRRVPDIIDMAEWKLLLSSGTPLPAEVARCSVGVVKERYSDGSAILYCLSKASDGSWYGEPGYGGLWPCSTVVLRRCT